MASGSREFWNNENDPTGRMRTIESKRGTMGVASKAMVAACHDLSADAGVAMLRSGGNAVDAFITTAFVDWVVNPGASSPAGPLNAMVFEQRNGVVANLFAGGKHVKSAHGVWKPGDTAPGKLVMVPGAVPGLQILHRRYGRKPWRTLLEPAIARAREGFPVVRLYAVLVARASAILQASEYGRSTFFPNGRAVSVGDTLKLPEVARTLERVAEEGAEYMQTGEWAREAVGAVNAAGGSMTLADLAEYRPYWATPLHGTYRAYDVYAPGTQDAGGARLLMALGALDRFDIRRIGHWSRSASSLELMTRLFIDIENVSWLDDYRTMSDAARVARLVPRTAAALASRVAAPTIPQAAEHHSYHICVVDESGMTVTGTHTIESLPWGNIGIFVGGIPLNGAAFLTPDVPAGGYEIAPFTSAIVLRNGEFVAEEGAFSSALFPADYQTLSNVLDFGMTPEEALLTPRFGYYSLDLEKMSVDTSTIMLDPRYPPALVQSAERSGLKFTQAGYVDTGMVVMIVRDPATGRLMGFTPEILPEGKAVGY